MKDKERLKFFKQRKIIGIDPGKNGGISVYTCDENRIIESVKMPETMQELYSMLYSYKYNSVCYLERVQGIPGNGAAGMFNFGRGFGHLEMALLALKIPYVEVTPQKWQKALQLGHKGTKTATQWKNKLKERAEQLYPGVKVTLSVADSLLIVEYGRLTEGSKL